MVDARIDAGGARARVLRIQRADSSWDSCVRRARARAGRETDERARMGSFGRAQALREALLEASTEGRVDVERAARALGTSPDATRWMFDAMRATSERTVEDFGERVVGEEATCETRRLCGFLLTLCYTAARGQSTSVFRDETAVGSSFDEGGDGWSEGGTGRGMAPMSPPPRSPSKRAMLRRASPPGEHGPGDGLGAWSGEADDAAFGTFLLQNWDALVRGCQLSKEGSSTMTREEVASLDFLFEARDGHGDARTLAECAMEGKEKIDAAALREWVARHLSDPLHGAGLSAGVAAVAAIADLAIEESDFGSKTVVCIDGAHKTTVVRRQGCETTRVASGSTACCRTSPRDLPTFGSPRYVREATPCAKITDCTDSIIYLLEPYHYLSVVGCVDCVIVVGAVARSALVEACERVTLICASKRVAVRSCFECTFHLGIMNQPMFVGDNRKCVLAPYNTFYEHLGEHLVEARLAPEACTAWDRPAVLGDDVTIQDGSSSPIASDVVRISSGVSLMAPDAFSLFIVPFRRYTEGEPTASDSAEAAPPTPSTVVPTTQANPFDTPASYVNAMDAKLQRICDVRARVRDAALPDAKRAELQVAIQTHFKAWLQASGKSREVFDLSAIEREEILRRNPENV